MPVISRVASLALRVGEIAFGAVVAGIIGSYLHHYDSASNWPHARFIYTEVVAGLSILLALLWLLPFAANIAHYPADIFMSFAWFAVFGLLVNFLHGSSCNSSTFDWSGITHGGACNRWKAAEAFSFLSAIFWLASAVVGLWFIRRERRRAVKVDQTRASRRRWFGRSRV